MLSGAIMLSLTTWLVGLFLDANFLEGFALLRVVLPLVVMGGFILRALYSKTKS